MKGAVLAAGGGHNGGAALTGCADGPVRWGARQRWPRSAASRAPGKTVTGTVARALWEGPGAVFLNRVRRLHFYFPAKGF